MATVIAEAAALMSSRRKAAAAAADNFEATMVAAVAVAVGASAAAASDAGAGEKSSLTTSADDTAVDTSGSLSGAALKFNPIWHRMAETVTDAYSVDVASSTPGAADFFVEGKLEISGAVSETIFRADAETTLQLDASDAANALLIMDGANTDTINLPGHYTINAAESQGRGGKVAYDPPMSAAGEQASAQSTSAENGFIVSNPFPFTETASGNKDHSAFQFKPSMDHHAVTDPEINDIAKEQPEHPAQPHSDNFKFADDDGSADPGHATGKDKDISVQPSADPKIGDITKEQPEHPAQPHSDNFKLADDDGSAHPGHATGKDKDISVQPSADPKIGDIAKEQPEHPAQPHSDNFKFADDDGSAHPGHATGKDASVQSTPADNGHHAIADPEVSLASIAPNHLPGHPAENSLHMPAQLDGNGVLTVTDGAHPADLPVDVNQLPSFKFADDGSTHPGTVPYGQPTLMALSGDLSGDHGPAAPALAKTFNVPGTVMSDAASDKFIFGKGFDHDTIADHKPDMTEIDHTVPAAIQHLLDTAHDTNAVSALDPNHATAPQDMTKVQLPHHQGDFHFA
jgi:hypothetical protein